MAGRTLYDKIWQSHTVRDYEGGDSLLYIDRHLVQEVSSPQAFAAVDAANRTVRRPEAHIAVADHAVPTKLRAFKLRQGTGQAAKQVRRLEENAARHNIPYIQTDDDRHGIVHVIGPELGFTLPGTTLVCGDSHTCTHGAFGCIAFGIGTSECATVLSTQTLRQRKQKSMRVNLEGAFALGVTVKDVILALIAEIGTGGGRGYAIEFAGSAVDAMSMQERMTLCNMSIEAGSRVGLIAVDQTTIDYLKGRPLAPSGRDWDAAIAAWAGLKSDPDARFDRQVTFDVSELAPQISWGTSPEETLPVTDQLPDPDAESDPVRRSKIKKSLAYMALNPGDSLSGISIDRVFIGSCTNGRIEDLRAAASVVEGKQVAASVSAMIVPGSGLVKEQAEAEGLDTIFKAAGFDWREPGCSMCLAMNDDRLKPEERCASTSNRNFEGRQGFKGRTHLVSPAMAAAAAIAGHFVDIREWE